MNAPLLFCKPMFVALVSALLFPAWLSAQTMKVEVPGSVDGDGYFYLRFIVSSDDATNFTPPSLSNFDVLAGPSTSVSNSYQYVNGKASHNASTTYTYVLSPKKTGKLSIGAASVRVGQQTISSRPVTITVTGSVGASQNAPKRSREEKESEQLQEAGSSVSGRDLFVAATTDKVHVYEQDAVLLTYKLYSKVGVGVSNLSLATKPDFEGMLSLELPNPNPETAVEHRGGVSYRVMTVLQYVLFPQTTGRLRIPGMTFDCTIVQRARNMSPLDAFFNDGHVSKVVQRSVADLFLDVKPLPAPKPADFSGAVGNFSVKGELLTPTPRTNDIMTYRITVSGVGNMKLISPLHLQLPESFDTQDPKVEEDVTTTASGSKGTITYDYTIIPRATGRFAIEAAPFIYFDPDKKEYVEIKIPPKSVSVAQGSGNGVSTSDLNGTNMPQVQRSDVSPMSHNPWPIMALQLLALLLLVALPKMLKRMRLLFGNRLDTAYAASRKTLRAMGRQGTKSGEEVVRPLMSYLSVALDEQADKLSLAEQADLLASRGMPGEVVARYKDLVEQCQFAAFAPGGMSVQSDKLVTEALAMIDLLHQSMGHVQKSNSDTEKNMSKMLIILCLLLCGSGLAAQNLSAPLRADSLMIKGNYQQAAAAYEQIIAKQPTSPSCYNLASCYMQQHQYPMAILWYERALWLNPRNADARRWLQVCQQKAALTYAPAPHMFFVVWTEVLLSRFSPTFFAWAAVGLLLLAIFLWKFLRAKPVRRRVGSTLWIVGSMLLLVVVLNVLAVASWTKRGRRATAVVLSETPLRPTPSTLQASKVKVQPGATLKVLQRQEEDRWLYVELPDERTKGWVDSKHVEEVENFNKARQ